MTPCRGVCWFKPNYRRFSQKRHVLNKEDGVWISHEIQAVNSIKTIELSLEKNRKSRLAMTSCCCLAIEYVYTLIDDPIKNGLKIHQIASVAYLYCIYNRHDKGFLKTSPNKIVKTAKNSYYSMVIFYHSIVHG